MSSTLKKLKKSLSKKSSLKRLDKALNIVIIILVITTAFLALKAYLPQLKTNTASEIMSSSETNTPSEIAPPTDSAAPAETTNLIFDDQRIFPEGFTDLEKAALAKQGGGTADPEQWRQVVADLATEAEVLSLVAVGNDCFGRPTVFKTKRGQAIQVKNDSDQEFYLGMGNQGWPVPAGKTITITPELDAPADLTNFSFGYGCGQADAPSGLLFIE